MLLVVGNLGLLLDLLKIDVSNGILTVEDTGNLLKGGSLGLDVEEVDEDKLDGVPEGVEQHEVPVVGEVVPGELVCLAVGGGLANETFRNGDRLEVTYFPMARIAWTVMFMIIIPLARRWKGRTSRA